MAVVSSRCINRSNSPFRCDHGEEAEKTIIVIAVSILICVIVSISICIFLSGTIPIVVSITGISVALRNAVAIFCSACSFCIF